VVSVTWNGKEKNGEKKMKKDERINIVWKQTSGTGQRVRKWINFARYSDRNNCIGKGRILQTEIRNKTEEFPRQLYIEMRLDGELFIGSLNAINEEEE